LATGLELVTTDSDLESTPVGVPSPEHAVNKNATRTVIAAIWYVLKFFIISPV
jgi:hypothetical protein